MNDSPYECKCSGIVPGKVCAGCARHAAEQRGAMVIDIRKNKREWRTERMRCRACNHTWVAVFHKDTPEDAMECSRCGESDSEVRDD